MFRSMFLFSVSYFWMRTETRGLQISRNACSCQISSWVLRSQERYVQMMLKPQPGLCPDRHCPSVYEALVPVLSSDICINQNWNPCLFTLPCFPYRQIPTKQSQNCGTEWAEGCQVLFLASQPPSGSNPLSIFCHWPSLAHVQIRTPVKQAGTTPHHAGEPQTHHGNPSRAKGSVSACCQPWMCCRAEVSLCPARSVSTIRNQRYHIHANLSCAVLLAQALLLTSFQLSPATVSDTQGCCWGSSGETGTPAGKLLPCQLYL